MHCLYPVIKPYKQQLLPVGKKHSLYVEEVGNPQGQPVLILHAGPGMGGDTELRRFFDPQFYRIILFDQRGCGRSLPHADISENNTLCLIEDIESIRTALKVSNFVLFGWGWGSLLALLYAEQYPQHVRALLLYQLFLGRKKDINWLYEEGIKLMYPDYWADFMSLAPDESGTEILPYYTETLNGNNEVARMAAAKNWSQLRARCQGFQGHATLMEAYLEPHFALALAQLESFFIKHNFFISENQVLQNISKIAKLPLYIIQARFDLLNPFANAWDLHHALPSSTLRIVRDSGMLYDAPIIDALITASSELTYL